MANITLGQIFPSFNEAEGSQRSMAVQGSDGTNLRLIKTSTDGEVILGAGASDLFGASNPGAVTLSGNKVAVNVFNALAITTTATQVGTATNVSDKEIVAISVRNSLDQPVRIMVPQPTTTTVKKLDGSVFWVTVPSSPSGERVILTETDIPYLRWVVGTISMLAQATVAPSSGSLTVDLWTKAVA